MNASNGMMFDFIVQKENKRGKRVTQLLIVSGVVHAIALVVLLIIDQLRVPPVEEPTVAISFVDFASLPPPPPPPPPPKKRTTPKKTEVKPVEVPKPTEVMAPKEIPTEEKKVEEPPSDEGSDEGSDDGEEGGVEGGVAGGVVGGVVNDTPPPVKKVEPPPPPQPAVLDQQQLRKKRIQGRDPEYPPQAESRGIEGVLVAKINIGTDGRVKSVVFTQTHPMFERSVRQSIEGWVFQPHIVGGRPVPVVTIYKFNFRLQ